MLTPYESSHEKKPNVFGCLDYVHVADQKRKKLDPKSESCIFVGHNPLTNSISCVNRCDFL